MITKKMMNDLTEKYGDMAFIVVFSDWSGHVEDENDEWVGEFNNLEELKTLLSSKTLSCEEE